MEAEDTQFAYARATVHLPGFPLGQVRLVDLTSEYVQQALAASHLVIVKDGDE